MARKQPVDGNGSQRPGIGEGLEATRAPIARARHAPGYVYGSPELFELEKEKIFLSDWLCMGRIEELASPGDFMTFRVLDEPIVITRHEDGALHAFSNICAHRGAEVVVGAGNTRQFSCPYHGWSYDLAGRLTAAAYMSKAEGFDPGCRLSPLRIGVWAGWMFVNFDDHAMPLEQHVAAFESDFGFLKQERCRLAHKLELEFACNWKLLLENIIDIYHFGVLHPTTVGRNVATQGDPVEPRDRGGYYAVFNTGTQTRSGEPLFGRMPWLDDQPDGLSLTGLLAPNMTLFAHVDDIHPIITWPIAPDRSRITIYVLMPEEFFGLPNFREKVEDYAATNKQILEEDREMIQSLQRAMGSKRFVPGPMSHLESGVHHVINSNLRRIFDDG